MYSGLQEASSGKKLAVSTAHVREGFFKCAYVVFFLIIALLGYFIQIISKLIAQILLYPLL